MRLFETYIDKTQTTKEQIKNTSDSPTTKTLHFYIYIGRMDKKSLIRSSDMETAVDCINSLTRRLEYILKTTPYIGEYSAIDYLPIGEFGIPSNILQDWHQNHNFARHTSQKYNQKHQYDTAKALFIFDAEVSMKNSKYAIHFVKTFGKLFEDLCKNMTKCQNMSILQIGTYSMEDYSWDLQISEDKIGQILALDNNKNVVSLLKKIYRTLSPTNITKHDYKEITDYFEKSPISRELMEVKKLFGVDENKMTIWEEKDEKRHIVFIDVPRNVELEINDWYEIQSLMDESNVKIHVDCGGKLKAHILDNDDMCTLLACFASTIGELHIVLPSYHEIPCLNIQHHFHTKKVIVELEKEKKNIMKELKGKSIGMPRIIVDQTTKLKIIDKSKK